MEVSGVASSGVEREPLQEQAPQWSPQEEEGEGQKTREELEKSRQLLCTEFASVAGSDEAVAQCYLAENDWDMQVCSDGGDWGRWRLPSQRAQ